MTRAHLKELSITTVHVTHDIDEANILSDRIVHWQELSAKTQEVEIDGEK